MKDIKDYPNGAQLDADKLELLEYLLEEEGVEAEPATKAAGAIRRREGRDGRDDLDAELPLSFAQQRLWFLDQLQPGSPAYNMPGRMRLSGRLDARALEESIDEVVRRHESLRTTFQARDGRPVQRISPHVRLQLPLADLSTLGDAERTRELERLSMEVSQQPFNLSEGALLRGLLVKLSDEEHVLLLTMHHIVSDGWSISIFIREVAVLYEAFSQGKESPLEELPIQYADYAVWQREWLCGEVLDEQLAYWREQLGGELPVLQLPLDKPRPAVQKFSGAALSIEIPESVRAKLEILSRREGATLYMTLLAAFQTLLSRYSHQTDILVGSPLAGRNRQEIEQLIGFFVNTLVMRTDLAGNPTFRELLGRVREVALGAYGHQDVPFEKLVEEIQPERSLSYSPLFQVVFAYQSAESAEVEANGLLMTRMDSVGLSVKFDLVLEIEETSEGLVAHFLYGTELFEPATIERMAGHFRTLLESVARDAETPLQDLPLLTSEERRRILFDWNETATPYPSTFCLHQLFERQVESTPDSVALIYEDAELTYAEVNRRANRLAHHLQSLGVRPETRVGILLERGVEMVLGVLAVLKAGGAYVPLDPQYPQERIAFMLEDAEASLLLTQEHLLENVGVERARVLCLDRDAHEWAEESAENPSSAVVPDNVIYVMYTSGSTGRPKGVAVTHRGVVNALWWQKSAFELDETDCLLLKASLSFDVSVWETFTGWLAGARVVVARHGAQQDSAYLVQTVARYKVTTIQFVPSLLPMFLEEKGLDAAAASLRRMAVGGEAMPVELLERLRSRLSLQVHDWYGPTEGSIGSVHWPDKGEPLRFAVSIGRPIDNTTAHVLDSRMQPVPAGVAGELYLGGLCVARGYWNRPDLTAERFIPDPFSREPGARLYRTGDLTRHLPDGRIEYLGRLDHQVKIRGLRIELEEIEATLGAHRGVRECVVMAREDAPGDKRLVAYIVAQQESSLNVAELRRYLREQLPDYMIPSAFVLLDKLPLTPSGKADRKALPAPRATSASEGYLAPRTAVEEMVSGIWSEVLKVERVGVRDNFFELGGHSLLATQVVSRLRDAFGVELPLSRFFESPVVAELSSFVEAEMRAGRVAEAPPLKAVPREGNAELPLSFAQQRLWFIDQLEPGNPVYNTPGAVRLTGALRIEALERTLAELIRRHETLRTAFRATTGGEPVQVIEEAEPFRLHVEDLSTIQPGERDGRARALALAEAQTPFDLSRGRLVRARLLRFGAQEHTLLVTMHHIISDGWSMGVLVGEVAALYEAYSTGKESPLEGLPIQYADYAVWQREWLQGSVLDEQLAYWREQLANAPAVLELPTDRPRPRVQTFRGASLPVSLPKSLTEALKALSRQTGATLYMTLLAAFQTLLGRYTGQTDILTGTPVANRRRAELEGLIGFFVNTLVMRTDLSGNPSFRELLTRVRQTALGAYAHQDVPFEMLVEELQPERSLSYTPLFQVLFVLQNAPSEALELEGLKASLLDVESGTAKFDLMLSLEETSEGLEGVCEYSTDLFDDRTVSRMLEHLRTLLVGAVESPERRINELPLLTEAERRALSEWNATASEFPREACIHELVAEQAARTPESTAIVFGEASLSYRELNERANRVAHHLRSLGIGAETVAAVMMERSIEMLVGVLGVLKAGGAYLPLDPEYPQERLAFMLEDARARVLLTEQRLAERLPETSAKVVCLDTDWKRIEEESPREPERNAASTSLAYVVYTSGSTGRPKAVVMPHRAAVNLVTYQMRSSGEAAATAARTLQFASLSFDVSFQEIFSTWAAGGALVLLREDERRDGSALLGVLREQRVERLFLPFVALQHLAEVAEAENVWPSSLRQVVTAGEQLKITPHLARLFSRLDRCILDNHYGPTETHLVSMHRLEGDPSDWPKLPPIGRPISNAEVYLLDDALQPVPAGVAGELYVGGAQLARCYLNRPGQTAERFIPNAFSSEPGARLYRTGDLARYRADGVLEYLGRRDLQVKVRGFRVEVGEVEAVLKLHAGVKQAVVAALEDEEGRKRLVAYLVAARKSSPPTSSDLRSYLRERLPDYMIPSAFVLLDRLPLTPNGKVDRTALPAPRAKSASESYVAPRTAVEELTAGIWSEVLKVERVGVRDNFFELGGHSLLATQVVSRLRRAFKVELPLRRLFEHPSLEELAGAIEAEMRAAEQIQAPPVVPRSRDAELPLSFAQQRLWFLDKLEPESSFYNLPSAISVRGKLDVGALERSLREVVRRHEVLRTTFETVGGQPRQVITEEPRFHLPVTDLSELPETTRSAEAQRLATEEAQRPFNLSEGALLRGLLVKLSDEEHVLLLTMHHIVSDGWSISIFIREVAALYEAFSTGKESPLEELSIQYADYAVWQREWLCGEVLDEQLAYWRRQLAGAPPALELPTDYPRPAVQTFNGATASEMLPRSLSQQLQALSRREGVTLYMTLLAAFQTLLSRYSHQTDILVGSPLAGRNRQEIEQLIGFFVNTLVMRTDLAGNPTFRELLGRVREVALGAYGHQDVPFEKLVEEIQPERSLSYSPLFQVVFAFQNAPLPDIALSDLRLSVFDAERETAKFDLVLVMNETDDGLQAIIEYNTDLFESETITRMFGHFRTLLESVALDAETPLQDLPLLTPEERRRILFDWNETAADYGRELCIHQLFERQADANPNAPALVFEDTELTYAELNRRANRLAHHLQSLGVRPETRVGILLERGLEMVLGVLAAVKAGGAYVPLDPSWPAERLEFIASTLDIGCLLTEHAQLSIVHELQWRLPKLAHVVCLDVDTPEVSPEQLDENTVRSLWNHLAEQATDEVSAGGFVSSYTGEPFSAAEVGEYVERVCALAAPRVGEDSRVLEIGCGSGLIMFELAPRCGLYVGLDPSDAAQAQNRRRRDERGLENVELSVGFADEIDSRFESASFDLVLLASTAQFFPGQLYLRSVLRKALRLLKPGGRLLLADVMDARRRQEFRDSLRDFQRQHPEAKTKTLLESELYVDEDFFADLLADAPELAEARVLHRRTGFANELGYRYDVLLEKRAPQASEGSDAHPPARRKHLWTSWHLGEQPEHNPSAPLSSENVAYIIFTSGSTGVPKGVIVRHRSAVNVLEWVNKTFGVRTGDRLLFVNSLTFDLSVYDIFGTLAAGATVHVASRRDLREPQRLARMLFEEPITLWVSAPIALQQLTRFFPHEPAENGASRRRGDGLRVVMLAGDWIPLRLPDEVREAFPGALVVNLGGATETTVWSNYFNVSRVEPHWASIPYGKPIQNARYHILDARLEPVPVGVAGDNYIGGECLALGYTDAALTAERFIPDPFSANPGARMYRTGDRARYRSSGDMEFLGRLDHQVKIRGYRIELGEIESALVAHASVSEAVVLVREDTPGERRLVAYVVARSGAGKGGDNSSPATASEPQITTSELHSHLREKLPEYMIPSAFVMLDALPLTANGKLDRARLPAPDASRPALDAAFVAPASELERRIAAIWQEVLGLERVGMRDNFFELGGHSLLLVQMHGRLSEATGQKLSIVELFKYSTVAALAERLRQEERQETAESTSNLRRGAARRAAIKERARPR